jgi:hypothetical protein
MAGLWLAEWWTNLTGQTEWVTQVSQFTIGDRVTVKDFPDSYNNAGTIKAINEAKSKFYVQFNDSEFGAWYTADEMQLETLK